MSYVANGFEKYKGTVVGTGHCVPFVQEAARAPQTALWKQGSAVKGALLPKGTVIATFQDGRYQNRTNGDSHAALYVKQDAAGITVWDQWKGQPVHERVIRFKGGQGTPNNDGDAYWVVD